MLRVGAAQCVRRSRTVRYHVVSMLAADSTIFRPLRESRRGASSDVMRRLAFLPKTLNQFTSRWEVLDEVNAEPGVQRALGHCSFHPSKRRSPIVAKNFASIRSRRDTFAFPRPLARGRAPCSAPNRAAAMSPPGRTNRTREDTMIRGSGTNIRM